MAIVLIEVVIGDIDKCLLIDVINEMCDEFEKNGFELPQNPGIHYYFRDKHIELVDDKTLMQMFEEVRGKTIDVGIHHLPKPSFI